MNGKIEKQISIPLLFVKSVKESVIKKLNCRDEFDLHKTYEGLFFYKRNLKKLVCIYFTEKIFGINLLYKDELLNSKDEFFYNNDFYKILVFDSLNEKFLFDEKRLCKYIIFYVFNDCKYVKYIGLIDSKNLEIKKYSLEDIKNYLNQI